MSATPQAQSKISPAERLLDLASDDMVQIDALILDRMQSPVGLIPDLARHLVSAGGKRLRPLLTVASAKLCQYDGTAHHKLAAAVEFIHSATLLHDDVVDHSAMRRGKKAANLIWGNAPSILVGDFLFARAFNLMVETGSMEALGILSQASSVIAEGEVHQLAALRDITMSEERYMSVIGAKTAALFAAATEVAPVIAERPSSERDALRTYGEQLGLAFQLVDDALDYSGFERNLGKAVGDDFREGKVTLPVIRAYDHAKTHGDAQAIAFWNRVIVEHNQSGVDLERAVARLKSTKALSSTLQKARDHAQAAKDSLTQFDNSIWKETLIDLADFVVERAN